MNAQTQSTNRTQFSTAAPQSGFGQDASVSVPQKSSQQAKYVFFAGDLIAPDVKAKNPAWSFGGCLRPQVLTLSHCGGYIKRCEITPLRQHMASERAGNFAPGAARFMVSQYDVKVGDDVKTYGLLDNGEPDTLLRVPFYPSDQIATLTGQVDGVVEMPVVNAEQQVLAQQFLFPNWTAIVSGAESLPEKLSELHTYFQTRLASANAAGNAFFIEVANAALSSCFNFQTWGQQQISIANGLYEEARVKGWNLGYGADANMLFSQLGIQRKDSAIQDNAAQMQQLIQVLANNHASQNAPQPVIDDETRQLLTLLKEAGPELIQALKANQTKANQTKAKQADVVSPTSPNPPAVTPEPETMIVPDASVDGQTKESENVETVAEDTPIQIGEYVTVKLADQDERMPGTVVDRKQFGRLEVSLMDGTTQTFAKNLVERATVETE